MKLRWMVQDEVPGDGSAAGGGAATPPAADTPPVVGVPASDDLSAGSNVDWEDIGNGDLGDGDETPPADTPPPVVAPPPTAPVAKVEPKVETPPVVAPPPKAETPPPVVPPVQPVSHEEIQRQRQASRTKYVGELEKFYAIPDSEVPTLVAEPEKVLPRMLAAMHANVMDQVSQYMRQQFPQMLDSVQGQKEAVNKTLDQFYNAWPELKDPKYMPTVARTLVAYRQANPTAKAEDVINEGGVSALVALRLPIPERILKLHNADAPPATAGGNFVPAAPGSAPSAPPAPPITNPFAILAQEDLVENS